MHAGVGGRCMSDTDTGHSVGSTNESEQQVSYQSEERHDDTAPDSAVEE